jgi:rubrerythrin
VFPLDTRKAGAHTPKNFKDLTEREILALAIQLEEEDARIYGDFAEGLRETYPVTAKAFEEMGAEEGCRRQQLIERYRSRFGNHIPLIRRSDVKGFLERKPLWLVRPLGIKAVRKQLEAMEFESRRFYERAAAQVSDASTRKLLDDLAEIENEHYNFAGELEQQQVAEDAPRKKGRRSVSGCSRSSSRASPD